MIKTQLSDHSNRYSLFNKALDKKLPSESIYYSGTDRVLIELARIVPSNPEF